MIYRGFNDREVSKITEILERNGVQFAVGVPNEAMDHINDKTKRVNHKFMDSIMQFEIESAEFDKISPQDIQKLLDLRIYREEESPFTEEELANAGTETDHISPSRPTKEQTAMNRWASVLMIVGVAIYAAFKTGIFK
ncbi:hypothetical protein [Peredibacter starrii]|uniref:Uncharacterized protein n=1 Tax=Peredibacter starrii TaxID=28202 RepID=A0AAX4HS99_9BACT|nr:hypothetical protein [Peredibacter starrii]WPU66235.1 hypothetical protein SOO65_05700 [Peredibacter starrii]